MKRALLFSLTVGSLIWAGPASFANSPESIRQSLTTGDFSTAFKEAEALETAEGYALAAESLLSEIMLGQAEKNKKQAKRARKLAEVALQLAPKDQNARLQYAVADGFVARETGDVSAWMKKLPQKTETIIQAYRTDYPDDPRGEALLGAWHLAIARKAGNDNGQKWFGANISDGRALFQSARAAHPSDILISVNYGFSLLALQDEDFSDHEEAREVLAATLTAEPVNHIGHVLKGYAREALTQIDDREAVRDYAEMFLDGKVPELSSDE